MGSWGYSKLALLLKVSHALYLDCITITCSAGRGYLWAMVQVVLHLQGAENKLCALFLFFFQIITIFHELYEICILFCHFRVIVLDVNIYI